MSTKRATKKAKTSELLHCMRCHEDYDPSNNTKNKCVVEHDFDAFEGGREGSWYIGTLKCCGCEYKFHRHNSDAKAFPKECFKGEHTSNPTQVLYNGLSICICTSESCGADRHQISNQAYQQQIAEKKARKEARKEAAKQARQEEEKRIAAIEDPTQRRREARKARAERLGLEMDESDLNSDESSCDSFDCASDSSLVPPWMMDSDGDY